MTQKYRVIGLMSGTSLDGIDVALLETDGQGHVVSLGGEAFPYDKIFREQLRACLGKKDGRADPHVGWAEQELTKRHACAVTAFLEHSGNRADSIDLIGFHGQTIWHNPKDKETVQIGDGRLLAEMVGIDVVNDFRTADVQAGGHGAPLVPLYHQVLVQEMAKPVAIVNIGGVSNVTWIGENDILSFDTGPGNALLDDWINTKTGQNFDKNGALAATGNVDRSHMELFMHHPFFLKKPPKSLDRDVFMNFVPKSLSDADGAATLTMMTACSIVEGLRAAPAPAATVYITGGGRHNLTMMRWIAEQSGADVHSVDELGWKGDLLEAEAFAYLAVRSILGLPLSLPSTTAVPAPTTGGVLHKVRKH